MMSACTVDVQIHFTSAVETQTNFTKTQKKFYNKDFCFVNISIDFEYILNNIFEY